VIVKTFKTIVIIAVLRIDLIDFIILWDFIRFTKLLTYNLVT